MIASYEHSSLSKNKYISPAAVQSTPQEWCEGISTRLRLIALQSAIGGMALSLIGMGFAAAGYISPVQAALLQEFIDVLAITNALRLSLGKRIETDMSR